MKKKLIKYEVEKYLNESFKLVFLVLQKKKFYYIFLILEQFAVLEFYRNRSVDNIIFFTYETSEDVEK